MSTPLARLGRSLLPSGLALASLLPAGFGQWSSDPAVNFAVADAASDQVQPKLAPTSDGGAWVSWFDGIAGGFDVRLQKLDLLGFEVFPHRGVLVADRGFSSTQDYGLDVHSSGDALLAFRDDSAGGVQIAAARVSESGVILWSVQLTATNAFVAAPKIAGTSDGGAVVAWTQDAEAKLQKLDANGVPLWGAGVTLTPGVGSFSPSDLHDAGADAILAFVHQAGGFGSPRHLYAQKLDAAGHLLWGAAHVAVFDGGSLQFGNFPTFVPDGSGGGVFGWYDTANGLQCHAQHVLANGTEAFVHNGAVASTNATRLRVSPAAAFDPDTGATFLFWQELSLSQSMSGLYGQKFDATGARQWTDDGAELLPLGAASITQVRTLAGAGGTFVFWDLAAGFGLDRLFGARIDGAGAYDLGPFDIASTMSVKSRLAVARAATGDAVLAWTDQRHDPGDVLAQNVRADGGLGAAVATPYCFGVGCPCGNDDAGAGCANSLGAGAVLAPVAGTNGFFSDDLILGVAGIQPNQFGLVFMGGAQVSGPFGDGLLCVGQGAVSLNRFPVRQADGGGAFTEGPGLVAFSLANFPGAGHIVPGTTYFFQGWYRNPGGPCGGSNFNLTNALAVRFVP